jgi:hypothetical protein
MSPSGVLGKHQHRATLLYPKEEEVEIAAAPRLIPCVLPQNYRSLQQKSRGMRWRQVELMAVVLKPEREMLPKRVVTKMSDYSSLIHSLEHAV